MTKTRRPRPAGPGRPRRAVLGAVSAVLVVGAVGGCGGDEPAAIASAAATSTAAPATEAPPITPAPTSAPAVVPTTTVAAPVVDFAMPALVGVDLQTAQDTIQTYGVFLTVSHDLLGSRNQVLDSNWIVCDQNVAPGQQVTDDVEGSIDFGVVKREEACP